MKLSNYFLLLFLFFSANVFSSASTLSPVPNNIILYIGDGMGVAQITAGKIVKGRLYLEEFKHLGLIMTHSQDALVTDSAAAGTAIATGFKTNNSSISFSAEGKPLKNITEYAQDVGKATGLVVTSSITHATPAVFAAHVESREQHSIIAEQVAKSRIDVLFGGGWEFFVPNTTAGSNRSDNKDLLAELVKSTTVIQTEDEFNQLGDVDSVVGLFSKKDLPRVNERKPSLPDMTRKAIKILSKNKNGFFLMVEGSQIDWGGHDNNLEYITSEIIDFDDTIGVGLEFAEKNSDTLVIVVADHETGGFAIHDGSIKEKMVSESDFTGTYHTGEMVPVFAYGPGASDFTGIGDNTRIGQTIIQYLKNSRQKR